MINSPRATLLSHQPHPAHTTSQNLIRNSLQKPSPTPEAKVRHARTAYFTRVLGFPLSPPSYAAFLDSNPSHVPPDATLLAAALNPPDAPAWQAAAPKAELYVDRAAREAEGGGGGPAYPERFAELIRCIKEGKPVPGVVEIPDTILRDPVSPPLFLPPIYSCFFLPWPLVCIRMRWDVFS